MEYSLIKRKVQSLLDKTNLLQLEKLLLQWKIDSSLCEGREPGGLSYKHNKIMKWVDLEGTVLHIYRTQLEVSEWALTTKLLSIALKLLGIIKEISSLLKDFSLLEMVQWLLNVSLQMHTFLAYLLDKVDLLVQVKLNKHLMKCQFPECPGFTLPLSNKRHRILNSNHLKKNE